ncbi:hypothetical protein [Actinomadura opuntiae]|uniref:hypothetical protein n=1 Tax=Actinomadura sp. OS1-43 TaxID=604315 RepID=UPI00255B1DA0|nr:hypothetical protein [Actinomadura sp. OS1-43]MDL4814206.1 hypothetical protein [Actinomadura sp. OS1-43]
MPKPFRPAAGAHVSSQVLAELARLWDQAVHHVGRQGAQVTQDRLAAESGVAKTTVNSWATGKSLPRDVDQLAKVGGVLAAWAREKQVTHREWSQLLAADQEARAGLSAAAAGDRDKGVGRPLSEVTDPFALEVHRPITPERADDLPPLPPYVQRAHDARLAQVVAQAVAGQSGMAVLVAGSSAGKTRALWEALALLREADGWRLWHPFDPTRPEAAVAELDRVGSFTVVWLNETQEYLGASGDGGERVAAKLRSLLTDPARAPVLVLGTLWPEHHAALVQQSTSQVARVLDGAVIELPETFTGADLDAVARAAGHDARLAAAVEHAEDGHITQYLAGVPALLERYRTAPASARALMHAAMELRLLGHGPALPRALLAAAAPAYLTDTQWDLAGEDWFEAALAYASVPCKGVRGPLTLARPRSGRPDSEQPTYRLADSLVQIAKSIRPEVRAPIHQDALLSAILTHASPANLTRIAHATPEEGDYFKRIYLRTDRAADAVAWLMARVGARYGLQSMWIAKELLREGRIWEGLCWEQRISELAGPAGNFRDTLQIMSRKGRTEEVLAWLRTRAASGRSDALELMGFILRDAGRFDEAITWYRRAEAETHSPEAEFWLLMLLLGQGRTDEAYAVLHPRIQAGDPEALAIAERYGLIQSD